MHSAWSTQHPSALSEPLGPATGDTSAESYASASRRIACSPWEGIYLEQGQPWDAENEVKRPSSNELERFLAGIMYGE